MFRVRDVNVDMVVSFAVATDAIAADAVVSVGL